MARRGGFPGGGGMNMQSMLQQAQRMQRNMEKVQEELKEKEVEASAGGGMVKVKISGGKQVKEIIISPEVVDPDDIEMLQDLVLAAVNEGLAQADQMVHGEMAKATGGMNLGGMF